MVCGSFIKLFINYERPQGQKPKKQNKANGGFRAASSRGKPCPESHKTRHTGKNETLQIRFRPVVVEARHRTKAQQQQQQHYSFVISPYRKRTVEMMGKTGKQREALWLIGFTAITRQNRARGPQQSHSRSVRF